MRKGLAALVVLLLLLALLPPYFSQAAVTPYFMAVNDTLLPFKDENMPLYHSGIIYVPHRVFSDLGVYAYSSVEAERVMLNKDSKYIDFYTGQGVTLDQDGNIRNWPSARRVGNAFYVPLDWVCTYFDLTVETIELGYDIIPDNPISIIRIKSNAILNAETFVGMNKTQLQKHYNDYYNITVPNPSQPSGGTQTSMPEVTPEPTYKDVTIYLSFHDLSAGNADGILDALDSITAPSYRSCFFVSADDILQNPGLIRRISGSGHTIGIQLSEGTYEEYHEASALLFEAAKVKTVIVSAIEQSESAYNMAQECGLVFRGASQIYDGSALVSAETITSELSTVSGTSQSFSFACSENTERVLPDILSYLRISDYTVSRITETAGQDISEE